MSINIRNPGSFLLSQCSQGALTTGRGDFLLVKFHPRASFTGKANKAEIEPHAGDRYMVNAFSSPAFATFVI